MYKRQALAAGCPVVVKAHPAHPGVSELVARAMADAATATGMPEGVFAMLHGGPELGQALVRDPRIRAVGFTGSRSAGLALLDVARSRPTPIPVYAEMSSVNPVVILPGAISAPADSQRLAAAYLGSLTKEAGQFCTCLLYTSHRQAPASTGKHSTVAHGSLSDILHSTGQDRNGQ